MSHGAPQYRWRARPWRPPVALPVYYELAVDRRPVAKLFWTARDDGHGFYVGTVFGKVVGEWPGGDGGDRVEHRRLAQLDVERAFRDVRYGLALPAQ